MTGTAFGAIVDRLFGHSLGSPARLDNDARCGAPSSVARPPTLTASEAQCN
jgi:hypothetical protein